LNDEYAGAKNPLKAVGEDESQCMIIWNLCKISGIFSNLPRKFLDVTD